MMNSRLYILMRTDLASMNSGKGMAQAAHAANAFIHEWQCAEGIDIWQAETSQGFGTTITLSVPSKSALVDMVAIADALGYPSGLVHDPSYPVRDGQVTHLVPVDTCGYVFVPENTAPPPGLRLLKLHP
jgi:peptidyl-tRNA hydrolase